MHQNSVHLIVLRGGEADGTLVMGVGASKQGSDCGFGSGRREGPSGRRGVDMRGGSGWRHVHKRVALLGIGRWQAGVGMHGWVKFSRVKKKHGGVIRNMKQRCFICFYNLSPGSTCRPARVNDCDCLTCKPMIELVLMRCHIWLFL